MAMVVNRFDVYLANLDPTVGPNKVISVLPRLFAF